MTYRGHVKNGTVLLEDPTALPDGTPVAVRPLKTTTTRRKATGKAGVRSPNRQPTLYERLAPVIGKAQNLPRDMAENHDHYLYGIAKRASRKPGTKG
jgi:hypothetical protein